MGRPRSSVWSALRGCCRLRALLSSLTVGSPSRVHSRGGLRWPNCFYLSLNGKRPPFFLFHDDLPNLRRWATVLRGASPPWVSFLSLFRCLRQRVPWLILGPAELGACTLRTCSRKRFALWPFQGTLSNLVVAYTKVLSSEGRTGKQSRVCDDIGEYERMYTPGGPPVASKASTSYRSWRPGADGVAPSQPSRLHDSQLTLHSQREQTRTYLKPPRGR